MKTIISFFKRHYKQILFQLILIIGLFWFYGFEETHHDEVTFRPYRLSYFLNYLVSAFVIGYFLLPRFYYKGKYKAFFLTTFLVLTSTLLVEEFVLEYIYFPTSRYLYFSYFSSFRDVLPIVFVLVSFKFIWDVQQKNEEVAQLKSAVQESELQFLKTQINPHFLFNNLNNLYSYAITNSSKTPDIILELSSVLRYILYDCKEQYVPLPKEIEHLENFTNLNELQIEERGNVRFTQKNISPHWKIAPLILPVFIENAFKHSTASQSEDIHIHIQVEVDDSGKLIFTCNNSFLPTANHQSLSKGIGLENVQKRLDILYPHQHELHISDDNNLYQVQLTMQLQTHIA